LPARSAHFSAISVFGKAQEINYGAFGEKLMRSTIAFFAPLLSVLAVSPLRADPVNWSATSDTAMAISGDIVVDDYTLTFANGKGTGQGQAKTWLAMSSRPIRRPISSCLTATSCVRLVAGRR